MSITFEQLKSKLNNRLRLLPPASLDDIINEALKDIYKSNEWGFLRQVDYMRSPAIIETGTASVTKFSRSVTLDSTASALVMQIVAEDVPLETRQFRNKGTSDNTGNAFPYNITGYNVSDPAAIVLTIDPPYLDETSASIAFQILKMYYNPPPVLIENLDPEETSDPVYDFRHWKYFVNLKLNRRLRTDITQDQLHNNNRYYNRLATGDPWCAISVSPKSDGLPLFELFPAPKFERVYRVVYQRNGLPLMRETDEVVNLDESLILKRAEYRGYNWLLANLEQFPELKGSAGRFTNLMALCINPNDLLAYPKLLDREIKIDEEKFPKSFFGDYMRLDWMDYPFDNYFGFFGFDNNGGNFPLFSTITDF